VYLKQISRLSSSQGELATILVYPGYLPIFFAIFTFCSEVFAFMDLPFLPSPVPSCQILFRSLRVFLSVWWRHMYVISQPNFFIVFGRRLHKLEKLVSDPYLLFLANQNMLKLKPQKYTSRWKWWCVMSMKLLSYVNVYVKIQMYMSRYKCICQGTNVYVKVQMYMSRYKYICQGTNVYVKVQMYMSRYKCICQGTSVYVKVQMYMSRYKYICQGTNVYVKVQMYMSRYKCICQGTSVYVKVQMYMSRYKCICCVIKQMYHSRTGYLQKIPVLRQNFPCRSCSVQFDCLLTVIFHKYPARQWYIYVCITENVL
jgi:hypothetical protein